MKADYRASQEEVNDKGKNGNRTFVQAVPGPIRKEAQIDGVPGRATFSFKSLRNVP